LKLIKKTQPAFATSPCTNQTVSLSKNIMDYLNGILPEVKITKNYVKFPNVDI